MAFQNGNVQELPIDEAIINILDRCIDSSSDVYEKLQEYVDAPDKLDTRLYREAVEILATEPGEGMDYYVPQNNEESVQRLTNSTLFVVYAKTLRWLFQEGETEELMLLLYRGTQFLSLFYALVERDSLDILFELMDIDLQHVNGELDASDWCKWIMAYRPAMENKLEQANKVGDCISELNAE